MHLHFSPSAVGRDGVRSTEAVDIIPVATPKAMAACPKTDGRKARTEQIVGIAHPHRRLHAGRKCSGLPVPSRARRKHSLRLSWPRPNDLRRAIFSNSTSPTLSPHLAGQVSDARFVHISNWDLELHYRSKDPLTVGLTSLDAASASWNPLKLEALDRDLLEYCELPVLPTGRADCRMLMLCVVHFVASASLPTFGHSIDSLADVLVRTALRGESTASVTAARSALLAYSSLHRYSLQSQALELKVAALSSLARASTSSSMCVVTATEHIVAGMLLCSFEIYQSSSTSDQWIIYLGGVMTVLRAISSQVSCPLDTDMTILLDWVYYFNVSARLALVLWREASTTDIPSFPPNIFHPEACTYSSKLSQGQLTHDPRFLPYRRYFPPCSVCCVRYAT